MMDARTPAQSSQVSSVMVQQHPLFKALIHARKFAGTEKTLGSSNVMMAIVPMETVAHQIAQLTQGMDARVEDRALQICVSRSVETA